MNTLLESPNAQTAAAPAPSPANPSPRILVVEDDMAIRRLSAQLLVRSGYEVEAAEDGAAGWEVIRSKSFDLLITDHNMPKLSGLELVKKLRCARLTLPVILASGSLHTEELARQPWLQLAATLLKPFSPDELIKTVKGVLRANFGAEGSRIGPVSTFRHRLPYQ